MAFRFQSLFFCFQKLSLYDDIYEIKIWKYQ